MGTRDQEREQRLAEALRANLRRRKQQARDMSEGGEPDVDAPEASPPRD